MHVHATFDCNTLANDGLNFFEHQEVLCLTALSKVPVALLYDSLVNQTHNIKLLDQIPHPAHSFLMPVYIHVCIHSIKASVMHYFQRKNISFRMQQA